MNKTNLLARVSALIITILFFAASVEWAAKKVYAQHEGHDMPGMSKPKPKPSPPKRKPSQPRKKQQAAPQKDKAQPPDKDAPASAPVVEPSSGGPPPQPEEATEPLNTGAPTPAPSPSVSPSPDASPTEVNTQSPQATPVQDSSSPKLGAPHDHARMDENGTEDGAQPAGGKGSMKEMDSGLEGTGRGATGADSLMIMSGEQMDIRVGSSKRNFIPMGQLGTGTSWLPATTPMYMWYKSAGDWLLFFHGEVKMGVNSQGGPRGVTKFESQNWLMPMAFRRLGPGTLQLRGMFSFEPFTFPQGGAPQLFQTGETFKGRPIIDAQHPHDLLMELSASYTVPLGERATWYTYFGFPGEPALGPPAFMHRPSASENPSAPLTHHLQDSTHISFGVLTTGFTYRWFKLEASVFNGREPDEDRYDFEFNPWNSRSVRLSFAPNENWSAQWSYGLLKNPEALEPGDVRRMTASLHYNKRFPRGNWATGFIWGRNREFHVEPQTLNGYTLESTVNFLDKNYIYTRLELVDKNTLLSHDEAHDLGFMSEHPNFRIGAYTFGAARDIWNTTKISLAIGGDFTFYSKPDVLDTVYGRNPTAYRFFVRIRPSRMSMSGHGHGHN